MIKHTFLDKCCTIVMGSDLNTGLNPVAELNCGNGVSRALIHFDIEGLKKMEKEKRFPNRNSLKHILRLTNCGSVNNDVHIQTLTSSGCISKERATSFDVILFKVPMEWDNGKGVDFKTDFWITDNHKYSTSGCNWFQPKNGYLWEEEGIYTSHNLSLEYDKFSAGEDSLIISRQHFDIGNENFVFDITDYVNDLIDGKEENYGLCLAFSPLAEMSETEKTQYIGFFGPYTNTFFHPYLETTYYEPIKDNRNNFHIGALNRLYFYCDGFNLDEIPVCKIEGFDKAIKVYQQTTGVYYAELVIPMEYVEEKTIMYDIWDNIIIEGKLQPSFENEFVVLGPKKLFERKGNNEGTYIPYTSGINDDEKLAIGETREVEITFRKKYSTNEYKVFDNSEYRLYCMDGSKELIVFDWQPIDSYPSSNSFMLDTNNLIPNRYIVDIRKGNDYFKDVLRFEVVSNVNNKYI